MAATGSARSAQSAATPFWRDLRFWQVFLQIVFVLVLVVVSFYLSQNIVTSLAEKGAAPTFSFLENRAGFPVGGVGGETYTPDDSYWEAFVAGIQNTLSVVTVGLVTTTILGIFFGIFLLSNNWLVRTLARIYVEILRNTPLLVQIILWYFVVFAALPRPQDAIEFPANGIIQLSWRWLIYVVLGLFIGLYFRKSEASVRNSVIIGGLAAASVLEVGFWRVMELQLANTEQSLAQATALTSGNLTALPFLLIAGVLGLGTVAALVWLKEDMVKNSVVGLLVGLLSGVVLFYFSVIPGGQVFRIEGVLLSMSARGVYVPQIVATPRQPVLLTFLTFGAVIALAQWIYLGQITERTGKQFPRFNYAIIALIVMGVLGWFAASAGAPPVTTAYLDQSTQVIIDDDIVELVIDEEVTIIKDRGEIIVEVNNDDGRQELNIFEALRGRYITTRHVTALEPNAVALFPVVRDDNGRRYMSGQGMSPEYMAVLVGLVIYTSAFIAEIVRAGIQAVPKGQREAAAAVGLSANDTLSMIILPQALRVIIPPMGNQYLNLAKNSSLAIVASYSDLFNVMNTVINQSGQSVSGIILIMASYLVISLTISFVMNLVNQRFQLVTR